MDLFVSSQHFSRCQKQILCIWDICCRCRDILYRKTKKMHFKSKIRRIKQKQTKKKRKTNLFGYKEKKLIYVYCFGMSRYSILFLFIFCYTITNGIIYINFEFGNVLNVKR